MHKRPEIEVTVRPVHHTVNVIIHIVSACTPDEAQLRDQVQIRVECVIYNTVSIIHRANERVQNVLLAGRCR